jgi:hypothetical protein
LNESHETKINAMEIVLIALIATSPDRSTLLQLIEELALMTESFFPGSSPEERARRAARIRERLAYYVSRATPADEVH